MMVENILEVDSVIKFFGNKQVLTDVYLKCKTGDIVGVFGRNGAGKSTLLKIIFGTLAADGKFIRINNNIHEHPYKSAESICYLPQETFVPKNLSLAKIITLYLGRGAQNTFFKDSILSPLKKMKTSEISGGELRYFEVKLLLNLNCKFALLDEPFNGVAPIFSKVSCDILEHSCVLVKPNHTFD